MLTPLRPAVASLLAVLLSLDKPLGRPAFHAAQPRQAAEGLLVEPMLGALRAEMASSVARLLRAIVARR